MTIVEFLAARLETDRGEAQYVLNLMSAGDAPVMYGSLRTAIEHTCERVLADIAAKRAILARYEAWDMGTEDGHPVAGILLGVVQTLASAYAAHPDYQQEWKP